MAEHNQVEVYRAKDSLMAYLLKAALEAEGIKVVIEGELLQGAFGEIPLGWSSSPRILVESDDAPRAKEIIREKEAAAREARADANKNDEVVCLSCGTPLHEEEETCPQCGWSYKNGFYSSATT